jgi:type I restriction enzyme S subunit
MGKSVLLTTEVATNQQINTIVPDPTIVDNVYLYYELSSRRAEIYMLGAAGSTMPILNKTGFENLVVDLPSLAEQRRIADILGSLDDKIELNRRMNETLEAMARRLFRSWFVDFDPVHAKAALRREHPKLSNADLSRRALPNMAPEIAELFPDGFEESTLGPIPSGWNAGTVPDAIEVNPTRSLAKGTVAPWLEMSNMPTRLARALTWEHREFGSGTKFINGDTLVARITPCLENGKTAFVDFLDDGQVGAGSTEYIILRPRAPLPPVFAYLLARTDDFRQHLITNMTGTSGRQRAPAESLNKFPLVTPPTKIANCFGDATENLFSQMKTIDEESLALTATRDKLLPRLLSGELGVADNGGSHEPT